MKETNKNNNFYINFIKKILIIISIFTVLLVPNSSAFASNIFLVEKVGVGSGKILINDNVSEYIIEHDNNCLDIDFYEGSTIYIDSSPFLSYGDKIIITGFLDKVCKITSVENVHIKKYYVNEIISDINDKILVSDKKNNDQFLIEYGMGCGLSMWRYKDKMVDIDVGGSILDGTNDRIYLFDSGRDCKIWNVEKMDNAENTSIPIIPVQPSCPEGKCISKEEIKKEIPIEEKTIKPVEVKTVIAKPKTTETSINKTLKESKTNTISIQKTETPIPPPQIQTQVEVKPTPKPSIFKRFTNWFFSLF